MTRLLGPLRTDWQLKDTCARLIAERVGVYADEVMRQMLDREPAPHERPLRPRQVICREALERFSEDQVPCIVVSLPGTREVAYRSGDGRYDAAYVLQVTAFVQSTDEIVGDRLASVLALASMKTLLDGLGGQAGVRSVRWAGQASGDDGRLDRSQHRAAHLLDVVVEDVVCDLAGPFPTDLLPDPPERRPAVDPGDLPTVETVDVTTTPTQERP